MSDAGLLCHRYDGDALCHKYGDSPLIYKSAAARPVTIEYSCSPASFTCNTAHVNHPISVDGSVRAAFSSGAGTVEPSYGLSTRKGTFVATASSVPATVAFSVPYSQLQCQYDEVGPKMIRVVATQNGASPVIGEAAVPGNTDGANNSVTFAVAVNIDSEGALASVSVTV